MEPEEKKEKEEQVQAQLLGNIKIDVDPKQVNEAVAKAIIESSLGKQIKERLESKYRELHDSYRLSSDIDNEIDRCIKQHIREVISKDFTPQIDAYIKKKITDEVLKQFVDRVFENYRERF